MIVATFNLGRVYDALGPRGYLWLLTGRTIVCVILTTQHARTGDLRDRYLAPARRRPERV